MALESIQGVEIFSAGVWNGDRYTVEDIDAMVNAFNETSATMRPYLKLGHTDDQSLLQKDGLPAAGWIGKLYRKGEKLIADFVDIPRQIYELIKNRAYRNVSAEIYWDLKINDKTFKRLLSAVALLGADAPAVSNLKDILSLYGSRVTADALKVYESIQNEYQPHKYLYGGDRKMTNEKSASEARLEFELDATKKELKTIKDENADIKKLFNQQKEQIDTLLKENKESKDALLVSQKEKTEIKIAQYVDKLNMPKSVRPYILKIASLLMESGSEKKYSIDVGKEKKEFSKLELLSEVVKLFSKTSDVNFDENSEDGDRQRDGTDDAALERKVRDYASKNKVSFTEAYRVIMKED